MRAQTRFHRVLSDWSQRHLEAAPGALSSTGPEDKHVLRALRSPAVSICGELAQFLALDYPTKLSPGRV